MKNILKITLIFFLLAQGLSGFSQEQKTSEFVPKYAKIQFAGNIGFLSGGLGFHFFDGLLYSEVLYGHVPKSISKADKIRTVSLKNTFPLLWYRKGNTAISPIAGFTISLESGNSTFIQLPDIYPKGYYSPNGIYSTLYIGGMIHRDFSKSKFPKGIDIYMELGTVDAYFWYKVNEKEVAWKDILSSSIGINFYF